MSLLERLYEGVQVPCTKHGDLVTAPSPVLLMLSLSPKANELLGMSHRSWRHQALSTYIHVHIGHWGIYMYF